VSLELNLRAILREELAGVLRQEIPRLVRVDEQSEVMNAPEYVGVKTAADMVSVSPGTIRSWMRSGKLPRAGEGRVVRVSVRDLRALLRGGDPPESGARSVEVQAAAIRDRVRTRDTRRR
jgi:hypothetical protein